MELKELQKRSLEVRKLYERVETKLYGRPWNLSELALAMNIDMGEFSELIMAKSGIRKYKGTNIEADLSHELSDLLWCVLVFAEKLGIDLESAFTDTMNQIENKLAAQASIGQEG